MNKKEAVFTISGLLIALFVAFFLSPFASPWPDGLEKVAEEKGFLEKGEVSQTITSPIPDYVLPGVKNEKLATSLAGLVGTLVLFAAGYGMGFLLKKKR